MTRKKKKNYTFVLEQPETTPGTVILGTNCLVDPDDARRRWEAAWVAYVNKLINERLIASKGQDDG
jgi:hypothetical protein